MLIEFEEHVAYKLVFEFLRAVAEGKERCGAGFGVIIGHDFARAFGFFHNRGGDGVARI